MSDLFGRRTLPQTLLIPLPFLAFFPQGVLYAGVLLFLVALAASGNYREKAARVLAHPIFVPTVAMFAVTALAAALQDVYSPKFWSGFAHYQIYLFLLLFVSVGAGEWQNKARIAFLAGAVMAATLFNVRHVGLLPELRLFESYSVYSGNNSILIGILMALASGILLHQALSSDRRMMRGLNAILFLYVAFSLLRFASTRTGSLIFVALCFFVLIWLMRQSWRKGLVLLVCLALAISIAWQWSPTLRNRVAQTIEAVQVSFKPGMRAAQDIRVELYGVALDLIREKPILGHGVAQWFPLNRERAVNEDTKQMAAAHNDYLQYGVEIGLLGVAAMLWLWLTQIWLALRVGGRQGMWLAIVTLGLFIGGAFNAVLRDLVFGMPFMVLLAIALAGLKRGQLSSARVVHVPAAADNRTFG